MPNVSWEYFYIKYFRFEPFSLFYSVSCKPKPTIAFSDPTWNVKSYGAANILTYQKCEVTGDGSYFLTKDGKYNHIIIIDFGCEVAIQKFFLRNSRHWGARYYQN